MALFDTIRAGASGAADSYEIERSIRLNRSDNSYLEISRSSDGNRKKWTFSTWLKVAKHGDDLRPIFAFNGTGNNRENFAFESDGKIAYQLRVSGSSKAQIVTTGRFRDPTAWYHILLIWDSDNGTSADRAIIYVNGVRQEVTTFITPASGSSTFINSTTTHYINHDAHWDSGDYSYAETYFIDGQAYDPSFFTETDTITGQFIPKKYTSGFSGNSFYLAYTDNSNNTATTIGKDYSGLGNNVSPQGVSVSAGRHNDSLEDTPTNNYPVVNPLNSREPDRISNGNLDIDYTDSDNNVSSVATFAMRSGKYYFEVLCRAGSSSVNNSLIGIAPDSYQKLKQNNQSAWPGKDTDSGVGIDGSGAKYVDGSESTYAASFTTNDIIGVAVDADAAKVAFSKNGQFSDGNGNYNQGANVASGGQVPIDGTGPYFPVFADTSASRNPQFSINFGQRAFSHSIPSGYQKLNSQNLPEPTVPRGDEYFETLLYTGQNTSSLYNVTGLEFQPDWVWGKSRNDNIEHILFDAVRGEDKQIATSGTGAEVVRSSAAYRFLSNGFAVSTVGNLNNPVNYVAWCWDAGGSTVTNTDGTISSQVRANTSAGFSIATWTSDGSGSPTSFGHGLGVRPDFLIIMNRSSSGNKQCWFSTFSNATNNFISMNLEDGVQTAGAAMWGTIDSSVVSFRHSANSSNGNDMVGYFFSNVAGFSKAGKYQGNGQSDGSYVHLGFRPAFLVIKTGEQNGDWIMIDNKRDVDNPTQHRVDANNIDTENNGDVYHDFLANGFKLRTASASRNPSNQDMYYFAFAENPFKYARAR